LESLILFHRIDEEISCLINNRQLVFLQAKLELLGYTEEQLLHNNSNQDFQIRRALRQRFFGLPFHVHYGYIMIGQRLVKEKVQHS
jgi:hypothetical protein